MGQSGKVKTRAEYQAMRAQLSENAKAGWTPERKAAQADRMRSMQRKRPKRKHWITRWTPEQRQRASEQAKARYAALDPAVRQERWERSKAAFAAKYPERMELGERTRAAIADGSLQPEPCDRCGGDGMPRFDYEALRFVGWRCYPCRRLPAAVPSWDDWS